MGVPESLLKNGFYGCKTLVNILKSSKLICYICHIASVTEIWCFTIIFSTKPFFIAKYDDSINNFVEHAFFHSLLALFSGSYKRFDIPK